MARYQADVLFIASIYPGKLPDLRRYYGPSLNSTGVGAVRSTLFRLEPVPRGAKPFVLPIYDSFQDVLDTNQLSTLRDRPGNPTTAKPVTCENIAGDLLEKWGGGLMGVPAGARPGIIQIQPDNLALREFNKEGKLPVANLAEIAEMTDMQTRYFEFLAVQGRRLHKESNWKEITDTMRLAAEWMGYKEDWMVNLQGAPTTSPCPLCTKEIPNAAIFCPECKQQIRAMPAHIAAIQQQAAGVRKTVSA